MMTPLGHYATLYYDCVGGGVISRDGCLIEIAVLEQHDEPPFCLILVLEEAKRNTAVSI